MGRPRSLIVGYHGAHDRVRRELGSASLRTCPCGSPATQWSYRHDDPDQLVEDGKPYSLKSGHYDALCIRCHRRRDSDRRPCGTEAGYFRHSRRGERSCDACRAGHAAAEHARRAARRVGSS